MKFESEQASKSAFIMGAAFLALVSTTELPTTRISSNNLFQTGLLTNLTASRAGYLLGEQECWQIMRIARIKALRGKFAFVSTSSEEFANRKHEETNQES